ncbi:MAG TPA: adenylate/guanylate cyclase domain-containing protein [Rhizomicrobium sp.]|nr:adenylate/guanylate cyclase domain-containing protein [Rhizomicrobium sp.]
MSVLVVGFTVRNVDLLARLNTLVGDYQIAILSPLEPQDPDIVIAAINEDTLAQFPYREPVDRGFLADMLTAIAAQHPRAVGLDILLDTPSDPDKDAKLRKVLSGLSVPIAVSYVTRSSVVTDDQRKFLDAFVPAKDRAYATLATDNHDIARWIEPGETNPSGAYIPTFPRALAHKIGVETPNERLKIVWHGQPSPNEPAFREYPMLPVLLPFYQAQNLFRGKIVLIGSDLSLTDRHKTPFDVLTSKDRGEMPGIVIQAHALSQLLNHKPRQEVGGFVNFLIALACAGIGALLGWINRPLGLRIGLAAGFVTLFVIFGWGFLFYYSGKMIGIIVPTLSLALSLWATESITGLEARRQREFIQGAFSRYVSPKVVDQLVKDPDKLALEGERRIMSFIFTDIANFTTMSEGIDGRELQLIVNEYLEGMTACVQKYDGMVDKFIGDAVMAIFNAPLDDPDHAQKAVECALAMDRFTLQFGLEQKAKGIPFGITRIGVHTGPAVIGNFGSSTKFNYTAQGDTVNTASRLEGLNKHFGTHISVSDATKQLCHGIVFRPIAAVILKGKTRAVEVWEPMQPDYPRHEFLQRYAVAFEKLKAEDPVAKEMFAALHAELPGDPCVALHHERLEAGETGIAVTQTEK